MKPRKKPLSRKTPLRAKPKKEGVKKKPKKAKPRKKFEDQTYREMEKPNGALDVLARQFFNRSQFPFGIDSPHYPSHLDNHSSWQWLHILGRDESPILKYSLLNGICGWSDVHVWFTHRPNKWCAFVDDVLPGRRDRLLAMDLWVTRHSGLVRREDVLIENRRRFLEAKAKGLTWIDYDFSDYKDPVEELRDKLEGTQ